ncbi:MAG: hypothetical protein H6735_10405 [Alphaproteobacteria bacterium]|nr:hypothetical protein [Alphaproteobacteria bacterium]
MDELTQVVAIVAPMAVLPLTFLLVTVPVAGSWLSGAPSGPVLLRWLATVALVAGGGSVTFGAYVSWRLSIGAIGPWFPFTIEVPDGVEGVVAVEMCEQGEPARGRVVAVGEEGHATIASSMWDRLYGRHRIAAREASGRSLDAQSYGYEVDVSRGCSLLLVAVHPTSAWTVPFPGSPGWELLDESRSEHVPFHEVAARHPLPAPDPPAVDTGP